MFIGSLPIDKHLERYAPYEVGADLSDLSENEKKAIPLLIKVGKLLDNLYLRQAWSGNEALLEKLQDNGDEQLLSLFNMYRGPWAREDSNTPFIEGVPPRPEGGNFYPEDMTKDEFEAWVATLPAEEQKDAKGFYTLIQRDSKGELYHAPYSSEYGDILQQASKLLQHASRLVEDPTLEHFLFTRSLAFLSNKYLPSEIAWLKISKDSKFEVTAGPYEVYTDELNGYKASFEFYLHARDFPSSKLLEKFSSSLQYVEDHLPIPEQYKNPRLVAPPIAVVNQLFAGGDVAVPMTAAYNLPNDEDAIREAGSKLVLIKNVQEGKFARVLAPIAQLTIAEDQQEYITSDAFTTHILLHEVCHSNGPHHIVGEPDVTVRARLQEFHSQIEEAKADIAGLFAATLLIKSGVIENVTPEQFWVTFLASAFRSIRFGITDAHGAGQAAQLNYLLDAGGFVHHPSTGRYSVDFERIEQAVTDLTRDILILQGDGIKDHVRKFVERYANNRPETKRALERIEKAGVPVDIRPIYTAEKEFPPDERVERIMNAEIVSTTFV